MLARTIIIWLLTIMGVVVAGTDFERSTFAEMMVDFGLAGLLLGMFALVISAAVAILKERRPPDF